MPDLNAYKLKEIMASLGLCFFIYDKKTAINYKHESRTIEKLTDGLLTSNPNHHHHKYYLGI